MNKIFLSHLTILCLFVNQSNCQSLTQNKYVILTFEEKYNKTIHGTQRYYWVVPIDSINSYSSSLYPFFISNFSKTQFENCANGNSTDPTTPSINAHDYDYDSIWYVKHDLLNDLINTKKKLIQTVQKTWALGNKVTVKVYATPIIGEFCSCNLASSGQQKFGYKSLIFLANNFSEDYSTFWDLQLSNFILKQDYSFFNFKKLIYESK